MVTLSIDHRCAILVYNRSRSICGVDRRSRADYEKRDAEHFRSNIARDKEEPWEQNFFHGGVEIDEREQAFTVNQTGCKIFFAFRATQANCHTEVAFEIAPLL